MNMCFWVCFGNLRKEGVEVVLITKVLRDWLLARDRPGECIIGNSCLSIVEGLVDFYKNLSNERIVRFAARELEERCSEWLILRVDAWIFVASHVDCDVWKGYMHICDISRRSYSITLTFGWIFGLFIWVLRLSMRGG
jgi:hypothetical protein